MFRKYQLIVPYNGFVELHMYVRNCQDLPVTIGHSSPMNGYPVAALALVGKKSDIKMVIKQAYLGSSSKQVNLLISGIEPEQLLDHGKTKLGKKVLGWFSRLKKIQKLGPHENAFPQPAKFSFWERKKPLGLAREFCEQDIFQAEDALFATINEDVAPTGMVDQSLNATINAPLIRAKS